jgi:phosphoribosylglycinamide formyltransferase-1
LIRLGALASHGGTNLQAIIDACKDGRLDAQTCAVVSNNSGSTALARARREGIPAYHLSQITHPGAGERDRAILAALESHDVDLVLLAGYMKKLGPATLSRYRGRVLNIHPALLPRFGGKGMYGRSVHEAVLAAGEKVTGVTVHVVDELYDHGPIVAQCEVSVLPGDTPDSLSERVLKREHEFYVEILQRISAGEIDLDRLGA